MERRCRARGERPRSARDAEEYEDNVLGLTVRELTTELRDAGVQRPLVVSDRGVVGAGIGELLGMPVLSFAKKIVIENNNLRVERVLDDGSEIVATALPAFTRP